MEVEDKLNTRATLFISPEIKLTNTDINWLKTKNIQILKINNIISLYRDYLKFTSQNKVVVLYTYEEYKDESFSRFISYWFYPMAKYIVKDNINLETWQSIYQLFQELDDVNTAETIGYFIYKAMRIDNYLNCPII